MTPEIKAVRAPFASSLARPPGPSSLVWSGRVFAQEAGRVGRAQGTSTTVDPTSIQRRDDGSNEVRWLIAGPTSMLQLPALPPR